MARLLAWCVHLYTALGLVAAAAIAVLIARGGPADFAWAFVLMVLATLIDGTDGMLARRARVKQVLPGFDGSRLDDIVDFLNYTALPLLLVWRAGVLPAHLSGWLLVPLLASAYGFCQTSAKTDDGFFLGFPSYWNVVAFYLHFGRPAAWISLVVLLSLALLTFIPLRYLYPSQPGLLNRLTALAAAAWALLVVCILYRLVSSTSGLLDEPAERLLWISLVFPVYYMLASWAINLRGPPEGPPWRRGASASGPRAVR
ncbi:MAG: hypothetical protein WD278_11750 [Pirellulales bacterium]